VQLADDNLIFACECFARQLCSAIKLRDVSTVLQDFSGIMSGVERIHSKDFPCAFLNHNILHVFVLKL
jgi:hypothetical protein